MSEENKQDTVTEEDSVDEAKDNSENDDTSIMDEETEKEEADTVQEKEEDTRTPEKKSADEKDLIAKIKKVDDWQTYLSDKDLYEDLFFEVESTLDFDEFMIVVRKLKKDKEYKDWAEENA
ncbi:MAG: hypothetical protein Q7S92_00260 [Candidatus Diapherotrites archaeon]|nr:hypothetical protein [Candidatus Diapherotrites archaeon]